MCGQRKARLTFVSLALCVVCAAWVTRFADFTVSQGQSGPSDLSAISRPSEVNINLPAKERVTLLTTYGEHNGSLSHVEGRWGLSPDTGTAVVQSNFPQPAKSEAV